MSKDSEKDPVTIEPIYFPDPLQCDACKKKFCHVVRRYDSDERFCKNCFAHRYSLDEMLDILKKMDVLTSTLWEIPHDELPEEIKSKLQYIVKPKEKKE